MKIQKLCFLFLLVLLPLQLEAATLSGISEFIDEMVVKHHFKRAELESAFKHAKHLPTVIEAISRPPTVRPWLEYRASFVNSQRIKYGLQFWKKYSGALRDAEKKYGVPQEIIVAIIGVETIYGRNVGKFRTLDALTTLAFDYPRRAKFFRSELENYLLLAREQDFDLFAIRGSYAGALGVPQFMPSSYRNYAVDFSGDDKVDLLKNPIDAIGSVASYLKEYGWIKATHKNPRENLVAIPVQVGKKINQVDLSQRRTVAQWQKTFSVMGEKLNHLADEQARLVDYTIGDGKEYWLAFNNFEVITRYNNSDYYAMSVFQLAQAVKSAREFKAKN